MQVIFGVTGNTGGQAARILIDRGEEIRVVVRRSEQGAAWAAMGAEVAVAGMDDPDAVAAALAGADGAYLLIPPKPEGDPFETVERISASYAEAARRAGLRKAVVLSSIGAQHPDGTGIIGTLHRLEQLMRDAAPSVTFLRCGYFAENWAEVAPAAVNEGALPSFLPPHLLVPSIAVADVGRAVADLLFEDWTGARVVELIAERYWTADEAATAFSELLGRPVTLAYIPLQEQVALMEEAGLPANVARLLADMHEGLISGRVAPEPGIERRAGTVSLKAAIAELLEAPAKAA